VHARIPDQPGQQHRQPDQAEAQEPTQAAQVAAGRAAMAGSRRTTGHTGLVSGGALRRAGDRDGRGEQQLGDGAVWSHGRLRSEHISLLGSVPQARRAGILPCPPFLGAHAARSVMQKASRRRARLRSRIAGSGAYSLLDRANDRLATYEDRRLAEEIRPAAGDLVNRISRGRRLAQPCNCFRCS
jgi:hypothetical protein